MSPSCGTGSGGLLMIDLSSRISGAFSDSSVVKLFQNASVSQQSEAGVFSANVTISGRLSGPAAQAIESIMQIVMNANGDTSVSAQTDVDVKARRPIAATTRSRLPRGAPT